MTDAVKPLRQNVEEEAPDELVGGEGYCAISRLPVAAVILVAKGHVALVESHETAVRDGDAMSVAGEIGEHRLGPGEGRLGVEEPVLPPQRREMRGESLAATQARDLAEKPQPPCRVSLAESRPAADRPRRVRANPSLPHPDTLGNVGYGTSCKRCGCGRNPRSARHARRARPSDTARSPT